MNELVFLKNNQPMTNSLVIAEGTDNEHRSIIRLVQKHQKRFERWGAVRFMDLKSTNPQGGRPTTVAWLNEPQAAFLITLLRNNDIVLDFKARIIINPTAIASRRLKVTRVCRSSAKEFWS